MISINNIEINPKYFPDGTYCLLDIPVDEVYKSIPIFDKNLTFIWNYESESECMLLWYLVNHFKAQFPKSITFKLKLAYVSNSRMDRCKTMYEVFTLKYFAKFINLMDFDTVYLLDPHSNVSPALFNNVVVETPEKYINRVINTIENAGYTPILYFPDEGAMKRYKDMFDGYMFLYGEKNRDWKTGEIKGLTLRGDAEALENVENPNFLMIDDICSYGGTFYHSAKALKDAFPNCYINSWATHTENYFPTLQKAFDEELIVNHFTTNSLYRQEHDNIKLFHVC